MKKIVFCLILLFLITVKADLTDTQAEKVALFARSLITKGLNRNPYSYDDCKTWTFKNQKLINENGKYNICVRDKLGNITKQELVVDEISEEVIIHKDNENNLNISVIALIMGILLILIFTVYVINKSQKKIYNLNSDDK